MLFTDPGEDVHCWHSYNLRSRPGTAKGVDRMAKPASTAEIEEAIRALTEADYGRLKGFSRWRLAAIGRAAAGNTWEDLLQEAMTRTLAGSRVWNKEAVDFVRHLIGVIRSLCSELAEKLSAEKHEEPVFESELVGATDDPARNRYQMAQSSKPGPGRIAEASDAVVAIKDRFRDDRLTMDVIIGLEEGLSGPEIKEVLGISQKTLETIMRKLRRWSPKILS